jgi:TRAP-type mannitol/chloroaromatic compound transport system permease small subunit
LIDRLSASGRNWAELVWRLAIAALVIWMVQATYVRARFSYDIDESRFGTVSIWPARVAIAASLALLAVQLIFETLERLLILFGLVDQPEPEEHEAMEMAL